MNIEYIQNNHVIQRYLHGKLTAKESIEFEEYLLSHPEIIEDFELSAVFAKTLGSKAVKKPWLSFGDRLVNTIWPVGGFIVGAVASWLLFTATLLPHTASNVSPEIIYIGEMRGVNPNGLPPVSAVLEPKSVQQVFVLDVSSSNQQVFVIELSDSQGMKLQTWPSVEVNTQGDLVLHVSLQALNVSPVILSVREHNTQAVVLTTSIITESI